MRCDGRNSTKEQYSCVSVVVSSKKNDWLNTVTWKQQERF